MDESNYNKTMTENDYKQLITEWNEYLNTSNLNSKGSSVTSHDDIIDLMIFNLSCLKQLRRIKGADRCANN